MIEEPGEAVVNETKRHREDNSEQNRGGGGIRWQEEKRRGTMKKLDIFKSYKVRRRRWEVWTIEWEAKVSEGRCSIDTFHHPDDPCSCRQPCVGHLAVAFGYVRHNQSARVSSAPRNDPRLHVLDHMNTVMLPAWFFFCFVPSLSLFNVYVEHVIVSI